MLKNKLVGVAATAIALVSISSAFAGDKEMNFKGIQQIDYSNEEATTGSYIPGAVISSLELNIVKNEESVTGTWTAVNSGDSGTIQGTLKNGKISKVIFMSTANNSNVYGYGAYFSSCMFVGELALNKHSIVGTLNSQVSQNYGSTYCNGVSMSIQANDGK